MRVLKLCCRAVVRLLQHSQGQAARGPLFAAPGKSDACYLCSLQLRNTCLVICCINHDNGAVVKATALSAVAPLAVQCVCVVMSPILITAHAAGVCPPSFLRVVEVPALSVVAAPAVQCVRVDLCPILVTAHAAGGVCPPFFLHLVDAPVLLVFAPTAQYVPGNLLY